MDPGKKVQNTDTLVLYQEANVSEVTGDNCWLHVSWALCFTRCFNTLHDFPDIVLKCYKDVYVNSFLPRTARLWNSLLAECFL